MTKLRLGCNLTAAIFFLAIGAKWLYAGTYRKTGDIADIYVRYLGAAALGLGGLGLLTLLLQLYLLKRKQSK
jgi:hypothetical protein